MGPEGRGLPRVRVAGGGVTGGDGVPRRSRPRSAARARAKSEGRRAQRCRAPHGGPMMGRAGTAPGSLPARSGPALPPPRRARALCRGALGLQRRRPPRPEPSGGVGRGPAPSRGSCNRPRSAGSFANRLAAELGRGRGEISPPPWRPPAAEGGPWTPPARLCHRSIPPGAAPLHRPRGRPHMLGPHAGSSTAGRGTRPPQPPLSPVAPRLPGAGTQPGPADAEGSTAAEPTPTGGPGRGQVLRIAGCPAAWQPTH